MVWQSFSKFLIFFKICFVSSFFPTLIQILVEFIGKKKGRRGSVASLHLYCMYGYTVTVYYTCTVDSRTDPKPGTVFFSFRFHASTHHCRYYCLFLAVNYKNTLPPAPSSSFSPPSSSIVLVQRPQVTNDHTSIACCTVRVSNAANAGDWKKSDCCALAEYSSSEAVTVKLGACLIICAVSVVNVWSPTRGVLTR